VLHNIIYIYIKKIIFRLIYNFAENKREHKT